MAQFVGACGHPDRGNLAAITLDSVSWSPGDIPILRGINLQVREAELLVLVGPSGSGKTSLIRCIAGLEEISGGVVAFDDVDVTKVDVGQRDVGIVFQSHALFPNYSARNNVAFPLKIRRMKPDSIRNRVNAEARALGIEHVIDRWPDQLSAGHQQLVQIARVMVRVPKLLLLDEPMAHLDMPTRSRLRRELRELQRGYGVTTIYATNDPVEAMYMADRIAAIEDGELRQLGLPDELYAAPADTHIAWLTGPISMLAASVRSDHDGFWLDGDGFRIRCWNPEVGRHVGEHVRVGIRPNGVRLEPGSATRAVVESPSYESGTPVTRVTIGKEQLALPALQAPRGEEVGVSFEEYLVFDAADQLIASIG